jgi:hypothetical protein
VLSYPAISQKGEHNYEDTKAYKLVEKQSAGNAALLKYAGRPQHFAMVCLPPGLHLEFPWH